MKFSITDFFSKYHQIRSLLHIWSNLLKKFLMENFIFLSSDGAGLHQAGIPASSPSEVFLRKVVLKICSKFTGVHPCQSGISINLQSNFTQIALRHGFSPVNLLHIFRTPFSKNTPWRLLLNTNNLAEVLWSNNKITS